jgi:hypothetical protein
MKNDTQKLIKEVAEIAPEMSALTVDKISKTAPKAEEAELKMTAKQKAEMEGAQWITPKKQLQAFGTLKNEWRRAREHDWEYVKGMFQPEVINGRSTSEPKCFWFSKWPGDPDCLWEVPVSVPVYLPRMIAYYLSGEKDPLTGMESMKYHTFDYIERPTTYWKADTFTHQFTPTNTHYRGRFVPIGAFS